MNEIAKERGGKCLSTEYINSHDKLLWECEYGHTWWAKPYLVKNTNTWCPECNESKGNSSKLKLIEMYPSYYANIIEKTLQRRYNHLRKEGEWFDLSLLNEISFKDDCEKIEKSYDY